MNENKYIMQKVKAGHYIVYHPHKSCDDFRRASNREDALKLRKQLNDALCEDGEVKKDE
jgi:hypothetical protein